MHLDIARRSPSSLVLFRLLLSLTLLGLIKEFLQVLLLGQLLEKLKNDRHVVVTASLILAAPIGLSLTFSLDFPILDPNALNHFGLTGL